MSPLRDLLISPRPADHAAPRPLEPPARGRLLARRHATASAALAPSLGVLAPARELPAVAIAVGAAIARGRPAALVCLHAPAAAGASPSLRAPVRPGARRLAASLAARGLAAEARGRLALVRLPDDPDELSSAASRALAAAATLPAVLAVARRSADVDVLLGAQDAILVALTDSADPALAQLALAGATELASSVAALSLTLDPVQRTLAVSAAWSPRTIRRAIAGLVA